MTYRIESGSRAGTLGAAMYHGMTLRRRTSTVVAPGSWRRRAADAYFAATSDTATRLREDLASRVRHFTGRTIAPETIFADATQRLAVVRADDVVFRCQRGVLQIVRPCSHCGTGEFTSPTVESLADLGFALEMWEPRCRDCEPVDSETWMYQD